MNYIKLLFLLSIGNSTTASSCIHTRGTNHLQATQPPSNANHTSIVLSPFNTLQIGIFVHSYLPNTSSPPKEHSLGNFIKVNNSSPCKTSKKQPLIFSRKRTLLTSFIFYFKINFQFQSIENKF